VALLSCGGLLARMALFAEHPAVMEEVAPLLQRWVALPGARGMVSGMPL